VDAPGDYLRREFAAVPGVIKGSHLLDDRLPRSLAHPTERKRETVELNEERRRDVEAAIRGIHDVVTQETPPEAVEKPFCSSCAYHDFCWS